MVYRIILVSIAFVLEQLKTDRDDTPARLIIGRSLDFMFWFGVTALVAHAMGAFEVREVEARGYEAIVPAILALLWWGLKGVLFVLVPTFLLCAMLRQFESLLPRLVIYGVAASIAAWVYIRAEAQAQARAAKISAAEGQKQVAEEQALQRVFAEAEARKYDNEHRDDYLKQLMALAAQAHRRWQQDLQAAGAIGRDGVPPPFLSVTESQPHIWRVRNLASEPVCVKLVRAQRNARADSNYHCARDLRAECVELTPRDSVAFTLRPDETEYGCHDSYIEYRIGDALMEGLSWWSHSAVQSLERDRPDFRAKYDGLTAPAIKAEIERIEAMLAEPDRAARWRSALSSAAAGAEEVPEDQPEQR